MEHKRRFKGLMDAFRYPDLEAWEKALRSLFADEAEINICHPFNRMAGVEAYLEGFLIPLTRSFPGLYRRDYIVMGGAFEDGDWVSSTGYYAGTFSQDWLGIRATGKLTFLRFGEFHRFQDNKITESFVFLDIPELMIAAEQWPIKSTPATMPGYTGWLPGPATEDGILLSESDPAESEKSLRDVTAMLQKLATPDEAWRPFWHPNMVWYGPAAFGSYLGVENFARFQVPFEQAFQDWAGGAAGNGRTRHFTRFGDGSYTCSGGWPSLSGVQVGAFLDQPATNQMLYMRVCDWWRRDGDLLVENWVFVDIPDVLLQMGFDVFGTLEGSA